MLRPFFDEKKIVLTHVFNYRSTDVVAVVAIDLKINYMYQLLVEDFEQCRDRERFRYASFFNETGLSLKTFDTCQKVLSKGYCTASSTFYRCFLMDTAGYIITHHLWAVDSFAERPTLEGVHITELVIYEHNSRKQVYEYCRTYICIY